MEQMKQCRMLLVVGTAGAGKSKFAKQVAGSMVGWTIVGEEDGVVQEQKVKMDVNLRAGRTVVVDRCMLTVTERDEWICSAEQAGIDRRTVWVVHVKAEQRTCLARVLVREDHPSLGKQTDVAEIVGLLAQQFAVLEIPTKAECHDLGGLFVLENEDARAELRAELEVASERKKRPKKKNIVAKIGSRVLIGRPFWKVILI